MNEKLQKKPLALSIGAAFVTTLGASQVANAEANPFELTELSSGYTQVAEEMKCGAGKCGGKKGEKDGNCAAKKASKGKDGGCGEGKCGNAKCGEGKCAGSKAEKDGDGKCGAGKCGGKAEGKAKSADGKCGAGKCGGKNGSDE